MLSRRLGERPPWWDEAALDGRRTFSLPGSWNAGSRDSTTGGRMLAAMQDAAALATL